jgi:hypothetical protein
MRDFARATETAKARLSVKRDVHSLQEVASVHRTYADSIRELDWPLAVKTLKYAVCLLREAKRLNPRFLPARLLLPIALLDLTAYAQCSDEIGEMNDLPMHRSDRFFLGSLLARCLDGVGAHEKCLEFCNSLLKGIAEGKEADPVPRHIVVNLERVRAITVADGYCFGKIEDSMRMIVPEAVNFFARIVLNPKLREADDFCYLARFHEWMENYERAYAVLNEGESLYPEHWQFPFYRAAFLGRAALLSCTFRDRSVR